MNTQIGIFKGVPDKEYREIEAFGSSVVKTSATLSVAHANVATKDTPAMRKGRLAHCMVLEPESVSERYEAQMKGQTKAAKEDKARILAEGRTPVPPSEWDMVEAASKEILASPRAAAIFEAGDPEVTIVWRHDLTGLLCKARIDWFREDKMVAYDLKTTSTFGGAAPGVWDKNIKRYGLAIQAVHYLDGLSSTTGNLWDWRWLAAELGPPFAIALYQMGPDLYESGLSGWTKGLYRLKEAERSGSPLHWPLLPHTING